jgi:hypothetical protein
VARLTLTSNVIAFKNGLTVIVRGVDASNLAYINMNTRRISCVKADVTFSFMDVVSTRTSEPFVIGNNGGSLVLSNFTFTGGNTPYIFFITNGKLQIVDNVILNFSANNQALIHNSGNYGGTVIFSNHSGLGFFLNTNGFTGLRWAVNSPTRSLTTWFVDPDSSINIPATVNMSDTVIFYGSSQALRQTVFDPTSDAYAQNLGTTKPLRFLDLNSASPDGAFVTRKTLFVNELGDVIPGTSTVSTDLGVEEDQVATASQTVFTLPVAPIGRLVAYWGGVKLPKGSVTYSGVTATYNPALNGGQNFLAGDVIGFVF